MASGQAYSTRMGKKRFQGDRLYVAGKGNGTIVFDGLVFEIEFDNGDIQFLHDCLEDLENTTGNINDKGARDD